MAYAGCILLSEQWNLGGYDELGIWHKLRQRINMEFGGETFWKMATQKTKNELRYNIKLDIKKINGNKRRWK
jgi:hypothetical protein